LKIKLINGDELVEIWSKTLENETEMARTLTRGHTNDFSFIV